MKKYLLVFTLLLVWLGRSFLAHAQAPAWQTVMPITAVAGQYLELTGSTATPSGYVYVTGSFQGTINLGAITLTSIGGADLFIAKWEPATNRFIWAQQAGGAGGDFAQAIAVEGVNVYVTGYSTSTITQFGTTTLTKAGNNQFVAKLTDAGSAASFTWALQCGGTGSTRGAALTAAGPNVYLAGEFEAGNPVFGSTTLTSAGNSDIYVAKLTDAGSTASFTWALAAGGTNSEGVAALAIQGNSLYVAGNYRSALAQFGILTLQNGSISLPSPNADAYVVKLVDAGNTASFIWAQRAGGPDNDDFAMQLAVGGPAVYVVGSFSSNNNGLATANFGNIVLQTAGHSDAFVTKLTDTGASSSFAWALRAGGTDLDGANGIIVHGTDVYIAGSFSSPTATFGTTQVTNTSSARTADVFLAKLTDAGGTANFSWVQQAGGAGSDYPVGIALSSGGAMSVVGNAVAPAVFGNQPLTTTSMTNNGFVATLTGGGLLSTVTPAALTALQVTPNPAHISTRVLVPPLPGAEHVSFTLLNALGQAVRATGPVTLLATGLTYEMNLAGLSPGLYLLQVQVEATTAVRRVAIE